MILASSELAQSAVIGLVVLMGILAGLLGANSARDPDRRSSPWPFVVAIVSVAAVLTVVVVTGD